MIVSILDKAPLKGEKRYQITILHIEFVWTQFFLQCLIHKKITLQTVMKKVLTLI